MELICNYCVPRRHFSNVDKNFDHLDEVHKTFRCYICIEDFGSYITYRNHYSTEHPGRCYIPICREVAGKDNIDIDRHIDKVHRYYSCKTCIMVFNSGNELRMHYANPKDTQLYWCNLCRRDLFTNEDFWAHCYENHRDACALCDIELTEYFNFKVQWDNHLRTIHKLFPCSYCLQVFQDDSEKNIHNNDAHRISCTICNDTFPNESARRNHFVLKHHHTCPYCAKNFSDDTEKDNHIMFIHLLQCNICHEYLPNSVTLRHHYNTEHLFTCFACERAFGREADRDRHISMMHLLRCDICTKVCTTITELQLHYSVMHKDFHEKNNIAEQKSKSHDYREHICSVCSKIYSNEKEFLKHCGMCRGHQCASCGDSFSNEEDLMAHQVTNHLGFKEEICVNEENELYNGTEED